MQYSITYRRDIDGLRAVAVLSVIFYHFGVPYFRGGFVGVDIFFVISGFLIGGHIADDVSVGRFSLAQFYERRIRRIFPALYCLLALVLLVAPAILFPPDLAKLARVAFYVIPFLANFEIERTLHSYSGSSVQNSPLAHTWSLAVEEQFYLLFPLLMLLVARWTRRRYWLILLPLALLSLFASVLAARVMPIEDFYFAPFRAWELLLGVLLATSKIDPPRRAALRGGLVVMGLALILSSDLLLRSWMPFPSEYALPACAGATLIIHAACDRRWLVGRIIDNPFAARIGLWSYSLYLIHWPVLVFAQYYAAEPLSLAERGLLLALTFVLSALSWRFIEQPFRGRGKLVDTPQLFAAALGVGGLLASLVTVMPWRAEKPDWYFPAMAGAQRACMDVTPRQAAQNPLCNIGASVPAKAVLWGDSHAQALIPSVAAAFRAHGQSAMVFIKGSCPPVLDVELKATRSVGSFPGISRASAPDRISCGTRNDQALRWIADHKISTVILAGYWIVYVDTRKVPSAAIDHLALVDTRLPDLAGGAAAFNRNFVRTLAALQQMHVQVFVVEDVPQYNINIPYALASVERHGRHLEYKMTLASYDAQQAVATDIFEAARKRFSFRLLRPQKFLCPDGVCAPSRNGQPLYIDDEHVSALGALAIVRAFDPIWDRDR